MSELAFTFLTYRCPICDRAFADKEARARHLIETTRHPDIVEDYLRLQFLLADREEALLVARRQRDEARLLMRFS